MERVTRRKKTEKVRRRKRNKEREEEGEEGEDGRGPGIFWYDMRVFKCIFLACACV